LYDLSRDPMEASNLAPTAADTTQALKIELEAWLASVARSLNGKDYT